MKIVFMGTPRAAVPSLAKILEDGHDVVGVYTQPDRPSGRGNRMASPPVKEFAVQSGLNVFQPVRIKTDETLNFFKSHRADVVVVVAYGRILPLGYLEAFPNGAVNVHFSMLPKYRGAAPVNWAIVNGEENTGVTTMKMDAGLDTGDILLQKEVKIGENENSIELMERLSFVGSDLLSETLENIADIVPIPQNNDLATYARIMKKEDGLINWNLPASEIRNRVRGFQPFPNSFTDLNGKKLTVWSATTLPPVTESDAPGEILEARGDKLIVCCGQGTVLKIDELQLEGKKRLKTLDFLHGIKIEVGQQLG